MDSSPGFVSNIRHLFALFRLGFPTPTTDYVLGSPRTLTRWLILLKARRQFDLSNLRPVVSTQFQILFHSPRRGSFHLSLTVLMRYRSSRVFSLGGWTPLLHTMLASIVLLRILAITALLRLRDSHPLRPTFPDRSASKFRNSRKSYNPRHRSIWFGLLHFRSPLLAESSLLLALLRCFSSDAYPTASNGMTALEHRRVSPFGYLRLSRSYTPHRRFSQYNTSFIGTRYLGIHCVPLFAFRTTVRSLRLSWHALIGITFALIILLLRRTRRSDGDPTGPSTLRHPPEHSDAQPMTEGPQVETRGLEPLTSSVQTRRSPN